MTFLVTEALKKHEADPNGPSKSRRNEIAERVSCLHKVCSAAVRKRDLHIGIESAVSVNRRCCTDPSHGFATPDLNPTAFSLESYELKLAQIG